MGKKRPNDGKGKSKSKSKLKSKSEPISEPKPDLDISKKKLNYGMGKSKGKSQRTSEPEPSTAILEETKEQSEPSPKRTSRPYVDEFILFEIDTLQGFVAGLGKLRTSMANRAGAKHVEVKIVFKREVVFSIIIRRRDLYLLGLMFKNGNIYEFGVPGDKRVLGISEFLGFRESYKEMCGNLNNVKIGHGALEWAVKNVMKGQDLKEDREISAWKLEVGSSLATICVMLIEGSRIRWLEPKLKKLMEELNSNQKIDVWMSSLIQSWSYMSNIARNGKVSKVAPPGPKLSYSDEDLKNAGEFKNWADDALAVLQQSEHDLPYQHIVNYPSFKLLLLGDGATGKTSFLKRHLTGEFKNNYQRTFDVELHPLDFFTNRGKVRFYCWDVAGQKEHRRPGDDYYIGCQCAIIMFDLTARVTYESVPTWHANLCRVCGSIPSVLCGNKADSKKRVVQAKDIKFKRKMQYYEISAKSNENLEKPFLHLARELNRFPDIDFVMSPALAPPEVMPDLEAQDYYREEMIEAATKPLPDDNGGSFDDDDFF